MLSLKQAAEEIGMTKPAVLKAIHRGSLSATKDNNGQWQIDPAELFRVYKPAMAKEPEKLTIGTGQEASESNRLGIELKAAEQENALLREFHARERRQLENTIEDLRADRDHWRQQASALLTYRSEPEPSPAPEAEGETSGELPEIRPPQRYEPAVRRDLGRRGLPPWVWVLLVCFLGTLAVLGVLFLDPAMIGH